MPVNNPFLLSVLVPAFNAQKYLAETLDSILNQEFRNFELLISDDGSTDNTRSIIDEYAKRDVRIKCFHNEKNIGKTATVNNLFKNSKGNLVTIHDADDISLPLRFEKQVAAFCADENLGVCGVSFISVDKHGFVLDYNVMSSSCEEIREKILESSQFHGPTMMMRRSVLEKIGEIYRPYFRDNYEDTDLAFRIIDKHSGFNLTEYLYIYRVLASSLCRRNVDVRNRNLYKVVAFLGRQRRTTGSDSLMDDKPEQADQYLYKITSAYRDDPSRIHREAAEYYFYWSLNLKAIQAAWKGFLLRPFNLKNIRTVLYIFRKILIKDVETSKKHYTQILS